MRGGLGKGFTLLLQRKLNPLFFRTADHLTMIVDRELVLIVSLVLSVIIILYIILVMKFVLRKARQKTKKEYDEPAATSFLDHLTVWYPRKFASTKCIPVQPRTYEELQRVFNFVYWQMSKQHFLIKSFFWGGGGRGEFHFRSLSVANSRNHDGDGGVNFIFFKKKTNVLGE